MKLLKLPSVLMLAVASLLTVPTVSQARDRDEDHRDWDHDRGRVTVVRDRDGDGHYNKKTYRVDRDHDGDRRYYGNRYYGGRRYPAGYYGLSSARYPYGYYYGPSISVRTYSTPSYGYSYGGSTAASVQSALRRQGYYRGPIDGAIGAGSRSAIRAFQIDRRLPVTGRIDGPLLRSLGLA